MARASIFADDDLDVSEFAPKAGADRSAPPAAEVKAVAEAARFRSREPGQPAPQEPPKREPRRYRTGRSVQFNVKASQETINGYYAIADQQGWVLGETLERALEALQQKLEGKGA
jgi:hypothetical protein